MRLQTELIVYRDGGRRDRSHWLRADDAATWAAWWERSKKYTLAIADAMPAADYNFAPFGSGAAEAVRSGDGARTFGSLMQHIG